jgi:DNA-binding transcriptional regulator YbjK
MRRLRQHARRPICWSRPSVTETEHDRLQQSLNAVHEQISERQQKALLDRLMTHDKTASGLRGQKGFAAGQISH